MMNISRSKAHILQPVTSTGWLNNDSFNIINKIQSVSNSTHSLSLPLNLIRTQRYQDFLPPALLSKFQNDPSFASRCQAQLSSAMLAPSETGITKAKCAMVNMLLEGQTLKDVYHLSSFINSKYNTDITIPRLEKLALMLEYYLVGGLKLLRSFSLHHSAIPFPAATMHYILTHFENEKTKPTGKTSGFKMHETINEKIEMGETPEGVDASNLPSAKIIERFIANCGYKRDKRLGWLFEYESSQLNTLPSIDISPETTLDALQDASNFIADRPQNEWDFGEENLSQADESFMREELALGQHGSKNELISVMASFNNLAQLQPSLEEITELIESSTSSTIESLTDLNVNIDLPSAASKVSNSEIFQDYWLDYFQPDSPISTTIASFDSLNASQSEPEDISTLLPVVNSLDLPHFAANTDPDTLSDILNTQTQIINEPSTQNLPLFAAKSYTCLQHDAEICAQTTKKALKAKQEALAFPSKTKSKETTALDKMPIASLGTNARILYRRRAEYINELNDGMENTAEEVANRIKFFVVKSLLQDKKLAAIKTDCEHLFDRANMKQIKLTEKKVLAMKDYYLQGGLTLLRGFAWSLPVTYPAHLMQLALNLINEHPSRSLTNVHDILCQLHRGKCAIPSYSTFRDFIHRCGYQKNHLGVYATNTDLALLDTQTSATKQSSLFCNIPTKKDDGQITAEQVLKEIEQNEYLSVRKLARKIGYSENKIKYILQKNGYSYTNYKWGKSST